MNNAPESKQPEKTPSPELTALRARVAALETAVAAITVEKNTSGKNVGKPCGRFASIGGIELRGATEFEKSETPIDFTDLGGKRIG